MGTTKAEVDFGVYVLRELAEQWGKPTPEVYRTLKETDILTGYLFPCYDTLHTQSIESVVADLTDLARERGVAI